MKEVSLIMKDRGRGESSATGRARRKLSEAFRWFAFDRKHTLRRVDAMKNAARKNVDELEMIAAEGVFEPSIGKKFLQIAKMYVALIRELLILRGKIIHAKSYPAD